MIKEIKINNYKCFKNINLTDCKNVNIIGGKNNVGKTSFLEAIFWFYNRVDSEMTLKPFVWRGIQTFKLQHEDLWLPLFHDYNSKNDIKINVKHGDKTESFTAHLNTTPQKVFIEQNGSDVNSISKPTTAPDDFMALELSYESGKNKKQSSRLILEKDREKGDTKYGLEIKFISAAGGTIKIFPSRYHSGNLIDLFNPLFMNKSPFIQEIVNALKNIEPKLKNLSIGNFGNSFLVVADIGLQKQVPIQHLGEGIVRMLEYLLGIASYDKVLIDEIENGFHHSILPKVFKILFKAAKDLNTQIFATTHSYECIQAAYKAIEANKQKNDFRYFRLEKLKKDAGVIDVQKYDFKLLGSALDDGWEVR